MKKEVGGRGGEEEKEQREGRVIKEMEEKGRDQRVEGLSIAI